MMDAPNSLKIILRNEPARIPGIIQHLLHQVHSDRPLSGQDQFRIVVTLQEAISNAIIHGNLEVPSNLREMLNDDYEKLIAIRRVMRPYCQRSVEVICSWSIDYLLFRVTDAGPGFDVSRIVNSDLGLNLEKPSGRGLMIMRTYMDEVNYNATGNELTLVKYSTACISQSSTAAGCVRNPQQAVHCQTMSLG